MAPDSEAARDRRRFLKALVALPALGLSAAADGRLEPTAACDDDDDPTPPQMEGPYFKTSSPLRSSLLETGLAGTPMTIKGRVLATDCRPVPRVLLDFWQADDAGDYDLSGFGLRGHQLTDDLGRFVLESVVPGLYGRRTRHLHVKVQAPNRPVLTTQLYFPNEPTNARDRIFDPRLVMEVRDVGAARHASFDFVVRL